MIVRALLALATLALLIPACAKHDAPSSADAAAASSFQVLDASSSTDSSLDLDAATDASFDASSTTDAADAAALEAPTGIVDAANAVRAAILARDAHRLAALVHPTRGVRFSPYAYVEMKSDVVLHASEIENAFASSKPRTWGAFDGSGDPIVMTTAKYFDSFVAFKMLAKCTPRVNASLASGNTVNNLREAYGNAPFVEYYDRGLGDGLNWTALRLVFEQLNGRLYLVGVIHDVWTI